MKLLKAFNSEKKKKSFLKQLKYVITKPLFALKDALICSLFGAFNWITLCF